MIRPPAALRLAASALDWDDCTPAAPALRHTGGRQRAVAARCLTEVCLRFVKEKIMHPSPLLFFPALLLLASGTRAQALQPVDPGPASIAVVEVKPVDGPYRLRNEQARQIAGMYEMSNGWSIDVRADMRHVDVVVNRNRPLRLLAISPRIFVPGDGNRSGRRVRRSR